ncbi:MAG: restriction endonuclease subunit S [Rhizobiales bacterium]|nr:restriction endonuclease subunit S [Hyphomicrobiales bacterium]
MSFGENISELVEVSKNPLMGKAAHWPRVSLGEFAVILNGFPWKSERFNNSIGTPLIRIRDVTTGQTETFYDGPITEGYWINPGDLLVGMDGDFNVRRWSAERGLLNQRVCKITVDPDQYDTYLLEYLLPAYLRLINQATSSVTVKHLSSRTLAELPLPIPPLPEQRRIVAKLDALTACIARARTELNRVPMLTENFRQAASMAAFTGMLTAEWRATNSESAQSDDELEAAAAKVAGSKRRKPPIVIDWKPNLEIPASWRWVSVDQVIAAAQYGTSSKTSDDADGVPVLRMGNIQSGELDWTSLKYLPSDHDEFPDLLLSTGDVLFNRTNSFELVGKSAVFRGKPAPISFASYLIRLRCSGIAPDLLVRYLNSPVGRAWVNRVASQQVGQANVNGTKLKALGFPLPPVGEQTEMNRLLTSAFARADRFETEAARARALLDRLESAILAKAFRGELVPQDDNDEPASVLLERIRAQRASAPKPKRGRRAAGEAESTTA